MTLKPAIALLCIASASAAPPTALLPFLEQHCYDCHDAETKKGGLDLDTLALDHGQPEMLSRWTRLHDVVASGEMPPKKKKAPAGEERQAFTDQLAQTLTRWDASRKGTVLRRLNRVEYEHTLQDLLGIHTELKEMLPEDGKAFGFDNVGEALDLSPVHLQRYMDAASAALEAAESHGERPASTRSEHRLDELGGAANIGKHWHKRPDGAVVVFTESEFPAARFHTFRAPQTAMYRLAIHAVAHATDSPVRCGLYVGPDNGKQAADLFDEFEAAPSGMSAHEFTVLLRKGDIVRLRPRLDHRFDAFQKNGAQLRGLAVLKLEVEGPLFEEWPSRGHRLRFGDLPWVDKGSTKNRDKSWYRPVWDISSQNPETDLPRLLLPFANAAFRRPADAAKVEPYVQIALSEIREGSTLMQALRTAQMAMLCSPDFLYLREPAGKLDDHALAARLSYMLISSTPDAELRKAADEGRLTTAEGLRAQTERLLQDPRASRFTRHFTGQWLNLREIDFTIPDKQLYPEFSDSLKRASLRETELFFEEVLKQNLSITNFIDSTWTLLNEPLAQHYGIPGVKGLKFQKVSLLPEHHRGGVMTHASVLKVSANGTTTSPVVRGIWVLERIMGTPPSPPPPGVPGVEPDIRGAQTLRQQLDQHRNLESCQGCHRIIDPPGFALENYDVIGGWRENYRSLGKDFPKPKDLPAHVKNVQWRVGPPVDASGTTASGRPFQNLSDFKKILLEDPTRFTRTLAEKLAVYATGRGMGFSDRPELDRIATSVSHQGYGFRDLIHAVVQSDLFRHK